MMKKLLLFLMLVVSFNMNAQLTSLTIDNQTPGWLSSKINYGDQQTLENIKVLGFLNYADLSFIGEMIINHNLKGIVDLTEANIVSNKSDNILPENCFDMTDRKLLDSSKGLSSRLLKKLLLPKSLSEITKAALSDYLEVDTLVVGGEAMPKYNATLYSSTQRIQKNIKTVIIRDGVKTIGRQRFYSSNPEDSVLKEVILPQTLKKIEYEAFYQSYAAKNIVLPNSIDTLETRCMVSNSTNIETLVLPSELMYYEYAYKISTVNEMYFGENIKYIHASVNKGTEIHIKAKNPPKIEYYAFVEKCIFYVPKGTSAKYRNFGYPYDIATVIEENSVESIDIVNLPKCAHVGQQYQLSVVFNPSDALNKKVAWRSSQESVATISETGVLKAIGFGETTITVTSLDTGVSASATIKVYNHTIDVSILPDKAKVYQGNTIKLSAKTLPEGTSDGLVIWSCNNESIATVDANGLVTGLKQGSCVVTATSVDGGFTAECTVTVMLPVTNVNLYKHELDLKVGQSETLRVDVLPANADDKSLTWKSENDSIAIVDERGKITGLASGKVKIYSISNDNNKVMDYCEVTVTQPVSGLKLNYSKYEIKGIGSTVKLEATVIPEDATNKEVRWVSSNDAVCMVSAGNVVATGLGTAVIIATTVDGGYMATCTITVVEGQTYPTGDVNEDGVVDVADVNAVINMMLHLQETNTAADVNDDGIIDVADLNMIINKILGI